MTEFFFLYGPEHERLLGERKFPAEVNHRVPCPTSADHWGTSIANSQLKFNAAVTVELGHNRRDQMVIWALGMRLIRDDLAIEMQRRCLTGYCFRPATVRFRDGTVSQEYRRLIATGWGGMARPESGVRLMEECPGCVNKSYSAIVDPTELIDGSQWSGEDFFIVWPLPAFLFVSARVAQLLADVKAKSYTIGNLSERLVQQDPLTSGKFKPSSLALYLPEDLAVKYGRSLGIV